MTKKRKASSLDTPTYRLAIISPIALPAPQRSQREIATPDDDSESYQFPSYQLELPVVLEQDSIASIESVDLEPILESVVWISPIFGIERFLQEVIPRHMKYINSATANLWTAAWLAIILRQRMAAGKGFGWGKAAHNTVSQVLL
jgi:hypothetical protein